MMTDHTIHILTISVIVINLLVMGLVTFNSCMVQRKVRKFTADQTAVNKTLLESLDTFSQIYVGFEAKINSNKKGITDTLRLMMLTSRMVLEIRQSLSAFISSMNPNDALAEGTIAGRAEEAMAMAKKETTRLPTEEENEATEVANAISEAVATGTLESPGTQKVP